MWLNIIAILFLRLSQLTSFGQGSPLRLSIALNLRRYYFKLDLIKSKVPMARTLDDNEEEDEEELTWDDDNTSPAVESVSSPPEVKSDSIIGRQEMEPAIHSSSPTVLPALPVVAAPPPPFSAPISQDDHNLEKASSSHAGNQTSSAPRKDSEELIRHLQAENCSLSNRVNELESEVDQLKKELQYYQLHYPLPHSESSVSSGEDDHPKPIFPIESYVKVTESEGESDGMIVLSNELNSDSDIISKSKEISRARALEVKEQGNTQSKSRQPQEKDHAQRLPPSVSEGKKLVGVNEGGRSQVGCGGDDEEEEEEGWDESGW
jgi:hypothetical protein